MRVHHVHRLSLAARMPFKHLAQLHPAALPQSSALSQTVVTALSALRLYRLKQLLMTSQVLRLHCALYSSEVPDVTAG